MKKQVSKPQILKTLAATGAALLLSSCFGGGENSSSGGRSHYLTWGGTEARSTLVPGRVRDEGGADILTRLYSGLTAYDEISGELYNEVAESITTSDNTNWRVKLKTNWKFSNGEAVTAKSFVDAWNYNASKQAAQRNRDSFTHIVGFEAEEATLSGLNIVNDHEFTVQTTVPLSDFQDRITDYAFSPLPSIAFADMAAFEENPIGNGPYTLEENLKGTRVVLKTVENYPGRHKPLHPGLEYRIYPNNNAEYADWQAGQLDLIRGVTDNAVATYKEDAAGREVTYDYNALAFLLIPYNTAGFGADEAGTLRRQAVSQAIDREEVVQKIYHGTRVLPRSFLPKAYFPDMQDIPGNDILKRDVDNAKKLWAQAQSISPLPSEPIKFFYNDGAGHGAWVEALSHQLKANLNIDVEPTALPTFPLFLEHLDKKKIEGFYRYGWVSRQYPSYTLEALYGTGQQNNRTGFSDPKFDAEVSAALQGTNADTIKQTWIKAETILMAKLPSIPLWDSRNVELWGSHVTNVNKNYMGALVISQLKRNPS